MRREFLAKSDKDRSTINHLNLEVSRLTSQVNTLVESLEAERRSLGGALANEKSKRDEAEAQLEKTRGEVAKNEERVASLTEELDDIKAKLTDVGQENRKALKAELADLADRLQDAERNLTFKDKTIAELNHQREERDIETTTRIEKLRETETKLIEVEVMNCYLSFLALVL